jgi:hypothetical protein
MKYIQLFALSVCVGFLSIFSMLSGPQFLPENIAFAQYPEIGGIKCDKTEHFNFHYHAHLDIIVNGSAYFVPAEIGIRPPDCIYWMHTHDVSGIIHIESPENRTFTLGQFFDLWGQKFNNDQIFDFTVDKSQSKTLTVYVNGTIVTDKQYRDIPVYNHEDIAIVYGTPIPLLPAYEFRN